jgi:hypothetical protein
MSLSLSHQPVQPVTVSSMKPDPLSSTCNSCQYHQEHISNHMLNINNTCLYQACTKITNIPSQDMCACTIPCTKPIPYHASIHVPSTCTINHVPTMYINYVYQHHTMYQPCTSTPYHVPTMYINHHHIPCTMKCASTICQEYVPNVYQACIYITNKCLIHIPKMYLKQCAQYPTCSSNHVPQPYTISLMICLNHAIHHNIINM